MWFEPHFGEKMKKSDLKNTILFKGMAEEEIEECLREMNACEKTYRKGSVILSAGKITSAMGLVREGSVTIESNDLWGNRTILSHISKGEFFAETYALLDEVMLVDAVANEDCRVLFLHVDRILSGRVSASKLTARLLRISAVKNLTLSSRSFHTASKSARARILAYLNSVSLQRHSREFDIPFDRQQMADYLNLERTNMSKELSKMQKEGLIRFRKNHFKLIENDECAGGSI